MQWKNGMSETSSTDSYNKTIKINDHIFLDVSTNMIVAVVDRVTLTMTLQEYISFAGSVMSSMNYIQQYVALRSSLSKATLSQSIQSGSTIF